MTASSTELPAPAVGPVPGAATGAGVAALASPDVLGLWAFAATVPRGRPP